MQDENLKSIISILTTAKKGDDFGEDNQKIQYFCEELKKINSHLPTKSKLEELQKIETDLEIRYEKFYELHNYFDPIYIELKKKIHNEEVKKIREENRRKRVIK